MNTRCFDMFRCFMCFRVMMMNCGPCTVSTLEVVPRCISNFSLLANKVFSAHVPKGPFRLPYKTM